MYSGNGSSHSTPEDLHEIAHVLPNGKVEVIEISPSHQTVRVSYGDTAVWLQPPHMLAAAGL
jgi:hypothetical protein